MTQSMTASRPGTRTPTRSTCEMRRGEAVVMLASDDASYSIPPLLGRSTGAGIYLVTDDVDGLFRRALDAGGQTVTEPEDTGWGSRRARVLYPSGREWSFGSHRPGEGHPG